MEIGFDYHTVCVGTCRTQSLPLLPSRPPLKVVTITRYPFSIIPRSSAPTAVANSFIFNVFFLIALQVLYRLFPGKTTFTASDESSGRKHFQNFPGTEPKRKDRRPCHEQNNLTRSNNNEQKWRKCRNVFVFFYPIWINSTFCEVWYVLGEVRRRCTFCLILCFMLCRNGFPLSFIFFPRGETTESSSTKMNFPMSFLTELIEFPAPSPHLMRLLRSQFGVFTFLIALGEPP